MATVCIVSEGSSAVREELLQEFKVRRAASCIPDLIFSGGGVTAAFLLFQSATEADAAARMHKLAKTFKHAFVLIPHQLLTDPAAIEEACRWSAEEALTFVNMPAGADFTTTAVQLSRSVFLAAAHEQQWRAEQLQVVQTFEAANQVLLGLPLPACADAVHTCNMLRMLGSLRHMSQCSPQDIAMHTDLDMASATAIIDFLRRH